MENRENSVKKLKIKFDFVCLTLYMQTVEEREEQSLYHSNLFYIGQSIWQHFKQHFSPPPPGPSASAIHVRASPPNCVCILNYSKQ